MADVTATRVNPLRTYRFRIKLDPPGRSALPGGYVAGVRSVSGLSLQVSPFEVWEGGNNLHRYANPNKVTWDPVVLEQGLALDDTFERWARAVLDFVKTGKAPQAGSDGTAEVVKRDVTIDVWDDYTHGSSPPPPGGASLRSVRIYNAWVSKYHAVPKLDAMAGEVALLSVELIHEGWELLTSASS